VIKIYFEYFQADLVKRDRSHASVWVIISIKC